MGILDIFSKRKAKKEGLVPDVYQYEQLPNKFRVQVVHIMMDASLKPAPYNDDIFVSIHRDLCQEYGKFTLSERAVSHYGDVDHRAAVMNFFLGVRAIERALDVIEVSFNKIVATYPESLFVRHKNLMQGLTSASQTPKISPSTAIGELNQRFLENGVGYQFESGQVVRIDSTYTHSEVVKPALRILQGRMYRGAAEEFEKAHEHYRHKRYKECLNECLKAFESTMKTILDKRGQSYDSRATASRLLTACFDIELIPSYLQSQFTSLQSLLGSGTQTIRNRLAGHGQGSNTVRVPRHLAYYAINLTASNILFLAESDETLGK